MKRLKDRMIGSGKVSSIIGTVLGAAVTGAAQSFVASGGNVSSWVPYAAGAGVAVAGLLYKQPGATP